MVAPLWAAELQPRSLRAYEEYVESATQAFLERIQNEPGSNSTPGAQPATSGKIIKLPGGLAHHWVGGVFVAGVDLDRVLAVTQSYDDHSAMHRHIVTSKLMNREGEKFSVFARVRQDAGGVSAVLDVWMVVTYQRNGTYAHSLGHAQEIRQVKNAGRPDEQQLPAGRDSGYLWRVNVLTRFAEREDGVYVELENIGLSRSFPPLLRWFIEPIARRVGRSSVERTLAELRAAVLNSARQCGAS